MKETIVPGRNGIHRSAGFLTPASTGNLCNSPHYVQWRERERGREGEGERETEGEREREREREGEGEGEQEGEGGGEKERVEKGGEGEKTYSK